MSWLKWPKRQTKDCGEWEKTFGMKKNPKEMVSEDILYSEKQKAIKEKRSCEWTQLLREKKWLLRTKDCGERGHTRLKKNPSEMVSEDILRSCVRVGRGHIWGH